MTRTLSHLRQADLTRTVRALQAAGAKVERVDICVDGKISVIVSDGGRTKALIRGTRY
jgi:hypothetical protein